MFVVDIDNFKKINDTMGHAFGDEVLKTLGKHICGEFRASDIIGRTGGDEFMVFLCNMKEDAIIKKEAKRLEKFFQSFQAGSYVKYSATASIGAAVYPRDAQTFEGLYRAADQAMYVAKRRERTGWLFMGKRVRNHRNGSADCILKAVKFVQSARFEPEHKQFLQSPTKTL